MSKATQEAERKKPGVCHHEAAHAVFAYHASQPIEYVTVGEEEAEVKSLHGYRKGDPVTTALVVSRVLADKYAQELAATGKEREHVPFEKLRERFEEAWRTDKAPEDFEADDVQAY